MNKREKELIIGSLLLVFGGLAMGFLIGLVVGSIEHKEIFNPDKDVCIKTCEERMEEIKPNQYRFDRILVENCMVNEQECYIWLEKDNYEYIKFYAEEMEKKLCDKYMKDNLCGETREDLYIKSVPKTECMSIKDCYEDMSLEGCEKLDCNTCCNNVCTVMACIETEEYAKCYYGEDVLE